MSNFDMVAQVKRQSSPDELELYSYVVDRAQGVAEEISERILQASVDDGGIIFVEGPLSSGKTIVDTMVASSMDGVKKFQCYQPGVEGRTDIVNDRLYSRSGLTYPSIQIKTKRDIEVMFHDNDVVIIDEIHLIPANLQSYFISEMKQFKNRGGWCLISSILYNSQGDPFVFVELCQMIATKVYHLKATCLKCGSPTAYIGQRLINGKPTTIDDPEYLAPSDKVIYEPRCTDCFVYGK